MGKEIEKKLESEDFSGKYRFIFFFQIPNSAKKCFFPFLSFPIFSVFFSFLSMSKRNMNEAKLVGMY